MPILCTEHTPDSDRVRIFTPHHRWLSKQRVVYFHVYFQLQTFDWNSARPRIVHRSNAAHHTQLESSRESRVELMQMKSKSAQWAPCVWTIKTSLLITSHPVGGNFFTFKFIPQKAKFSVELSAEKFCVALRYLRERDFTRRVKKCYWPINFSQWNCNVRDDRAAPMMMGEAL